MKTCLNMVLFFSVVVIDTPALAGEVFRSDFEGTVEVHAPSICTGCKFAGDIVGSSQGYSWDTDFPGTNYPNRLNLILGESGSGCTSDPECCCSQMTFSDWMTVSLATTMGPHGLETRALYNRINIKWYNGPPDYTTARFSTSWGGTPLMNEFTQQYWIKWPSEVETSLSTGDHWMSIFEHNTGVSPFMVQYIKRFATKYGGKLHWQWRRGGGATLDNFSVEVPIDRWFKISIYYKAGTTDGRYKLDIFDQGQLLNVFDYTGDTGPGSQNPSNFIKQYSDVAPLSVYYDDYALFDGPEPLTSGGVQSDGGSPGDRGVFLDARIISDVSDVIDAGTQDKPSIVDGTTSPPDKHNIPDAGAGPNQSTGCDIGSTCENPSGWIALLLLGVALIWRKP